MSKEENNVTMEGLQRDGWKFRVRLIRGRLYLSARKNGMEKGLGFIKQEMLDARAEATSEEQESMVRNQPKQHTDKITTPSESTTSYSVTLNPAQRSPKYAKVKFTRGEMEEILFDIMYERARVKTQSCQHSLGGYCNYWRFMKNSKGMASLFERLDISDYKLPISPYYATERGVIEEMFRINELFCFDCDKYTPRVKQK